jgi:predicted nucleotidyltransferase
VRLKESHRKAIKDTCSRLFPAASIYLFGSRNRTDESGGDIDLLIVSPEKLSLNQIMKFKIELFKQIGEQKIDIVNFTESDDNSFYQLIKIDAVKL